MYNNYNPYANMMANFNPSPYANIYPSQAQGNAPIINSNSGSGIIWVQGEAGAKAYSIAPNSMVVLWDSESQTIYVKSADNSGMPTLRILEWTEKVNTKNTVENNTINSNDFVTKKEFDNVVNRLNNLTNKINKKNDNREVDK